MTRRGNEVVLLPGQGRSTWLGEGVFTVKAEPDATLGAYSLAELTEPPGEGPPLHSHGDEEEGFYVLEGEVAIRVGDRMVLASPGAFVFVPRDVPHTYRVVGDSPARLLIIISPPGFEEAFFEAGVPPEAPGLPHGRVRSLTEAEWRALDAKYNRAVLGPPIGEDEIGG